MSASAESEGSALERGHRAPVVPLRSTYADACALQFELCDSPLLYQVPVEVDCPFYPCAKGSYDKYCSLQRWPLHWRAHGRGVALKTLAQRGDALCSVGAMAELINATELVPGQAAREARNVNGFDR